jgi:hypothetical protein
VSTFASSPRGIITRRRPGSRPRSCRWLFGCAVALVTSSSLGCATAPLRFKDEPIVWRVDDAHDIPEPTSRDFLVAQYAADILLLRRSERVLELRGRHLAENTNALDEVPDSTWFTNRIGVRDVTPAEAVAGPDLGGPPTLPLAITSAKVGGGNPGFLVKDAAGRKFLVKFDPKHNFELQTAAGVITNRFFWTIGYHVPSDHVFWFSRDDVALAPGATMEDEVKAKVPFTTRRLDEILAFAPRQPDGHYRATSSELLKGKPKGGFAAEGVRRDDPNDRIAHEHRRELRGLKVFAAWLDHTDMKEDNALDMYVTEGGKSFLRHYLLDFGETLGGHGAEKGRDEDGYENALDWSAQTKALLAFGLWKRPWEDRSPSGWASVGSVPSTGWEPRQWKEAYPYWPFAEADAADEYWAAKIVLRFDRPLVEALVATGQLSDPAAARYLVEALWNRRFKIGQAYLEAVTALDRFTVEDGHLCAMDLGTVYGLAHGGLVERLDEVGKVLESRIIARDGRVCLSLPTTGYAALRLRIRRASIVKPPMQVHVRAGVGGGGSETARIVGLVRTE